MKQTTVWIIWIVVIAALVLGGWYMFKDDSDTQTNSLTATEANTTTGTGNTTGTTGAGMKTTLGGIFDEDGSYQCDYEQTNGGVRSTNVVYIADGKLRGEFRTRTATSTTLSMTVYDGTNLYVWAEGKSTGTISQPKTLADLPAAIPEDITSGRILGSGLNNVSWDCHAWNKDVTKLVKPSYVTFR